MLNSAIDIAPGHPVYRMVRGRTFVNLPRLFLQFDKGVKDFELLLSWVEDSSINERYSALLEDRAFIQEVYYRIGEVYLIKGEKKKAVSLFKRAASINPDTPIARAALRRLNGLNRGGMR